MEFSDQTVDWYNTYSDIVLSLEAIILISQVDWVEPVLLVDSSAIDIPRKANLLIEQISLHKIESMSDYLYTLIIYRYSPPPTAL